MRTHLVALWKKCIVYAYFYLIGILGFLGCVGEHNYVQFTRWLLILVHGSPWNHVAKLWPNCQKISIDHGALVAALPKP